jgi:hypothetical protein
MRLVCCCPNWRSASSIASNSMNNGNFGWTDMRLFLCEKPSQGKDIARVLGAAAR